MRIVSDDTPPLSLQCFIAMIKSTVPSSPPLEGCRAAAGWSENTRKSNTSVIASAAKQSSKLCTHAYACDFIMTGSPRSLRSLAMTKAPCQVPLHWRGAAQRRGGQRMQESATSLSLRVKRSNPVNYARTRLRATLFAL